MWMEDVNYYEEINKIFINNKVISYKFIFYDNIIIWLDIDIVIMDLLKVCCICYIWLKKDVMLIYKRDKL